MLLNRESLMEWVDETISEHTKEDRSIVAIYLCGSFLDNNYLLGGTMDVDIVYVHQGGFPEQRQIIPITEGAHLDLSHHSRQEYRQPRQIRLDPWLGTTLNACRVLYDPEHFLDFAIAVVRGQFWHADNVYARASKLLQRSRMIHQELENISQPSPKTFLDYFRAAKHAANTIACLTGSPLTERRFLMQFQERTNAIERPGLFPGFLGLLGAPNLENGILHAWLGLWDKAFQSVDASSAPARLKPARYAYYRQAIEAYLSSEEPLWALWPLLRTWTLAVNVNPNEQEISENWEQAFTRLQLHGEQFHERIKALGAYLDLVQEVTTHWAHTNGVWGV